MQSIQIGDSGATPLDSFCPQEGNCTLWSCTKHVDMGKCTRTPMPPHFCSLPCTLICSLTQPESHPPISPRDSWPESLQIGSAMAVCPNPNPRLMFPASIARALLANPSTWGTPEKQYRTPPAPEKETLLFGAMKTHRVCRNLHCP